MKTQQPFKYLISLSVFIFSLWLQANQNAWAETEKVTAFVDVTLVPMTAETIIPHQTVLVKGRRIVAIGPSKQVDIPDEIAHMRSWISNSWILIDPDP